MVRRGFNGSSPSESSSEKTKPLQMRFLVAVTDTVEHLLAREGVDRPQGGSFGGDRRADRSSLDVACQVRLDGLGRRHDAGSATTDSPESSQGKMGLSGIRAAVSRFGS